MADLGQTTSAGGHAVDRTLALALATSGWLLAVEGRQGLARDEAQYFRAGERYWGWFEELGAAVRAGKPGRAFSRAVVDSYWGDNHEHPPLMKTLYGLSWRLFHRCDLRGAQAGPPPNRDTRQAPHAAAFLARVDRLSFPAIFAGRPGCGTGLRIRAPLGRALGRRGRGRAFGRATALLLPRPDLVLRCAHRGDGPAGRVGLLEIAALAPLGHSVRRLLWLGPGHQAQRLVDSLFPSRPLSVDAAGDFTWEPSKGSQTLPRWCAAGKAGGLPTRLRLRLPRIPLAFLSMASLGPSSCSRSGPGCGTLRCRACANGCSGTRNTSTTTSSISAATGTCPRRQRKPVAGFCARRFPLYRPGSPCRPPPWPWQQPVRWSWPPASQRRADRRARRDHSRVARARNARFMAAARRRCGPGARNVFGGADPGPIGTLALPSTPIFGGVKHFLAAMPFLAMLAGVGMAWVTRQATSLVRPSRLRHALPAALAGLLCLPAVAETQRSHPDGVGHYNLLVGGFSGGGNAGYEPAVLGYSVLPLLPWMKAHRPPSNRVYWHDVLHDAVMMYVRDGRLTSRNWRHGRGRICGGAVGSRSRHLGKAFRGLRVPALEAFQTTQPAQVYAHEGVPFVVVYQRKAPPPRQEPLPP